MKEAFVKLDSGELFYRSNGSGPVVMLVHGFGEDSTVWKHQYEALPGYRLLLPDLPGSGKTPMSKDLGMEGMAGVLKQLLVALNIEKCIMIGHSMGGYVTMAFAEKYNSFLAAFGLIHSTAYADSEEKKAARRKGIEFIKENGAFAFLKSVTPNLFSPETREK